MTEHTILIVDDSPLELLGIREVLERADFSVVTYQIKSFTEVFALSELVMDEKPHLILMDVNLGLKSYDGIRLAKTICRLREPGERLPLMVLHSSLSAPELLALQKRSDADAFLEKGEATALPMRVRQILNRLLVQI